MKIKEIHLKNVKTYKDKVITFDSDKKIYATAGKNGMGKTTLQEAIRFILTGEAPDNIIKKGEVEATVTAYLEDGTVIERTKSLVGSAKSSQRLNGKTVTGTKMNEFIDARADAMPNDLKNALNPNVLDLLNPQQLSNCLLKTTGALTEMDDIVSYTESTDEELIKQLKSYLDNKSEVTMEDIEAAYKKAYADRSEYKKIIERLKANIESVIYDTPVETLEEVNRKIESLVKEEGALESTKLAIKTYEKAVEGKEKHEAFVKKLETDIAANTSTAPVKAKLDKIVEEKTNLNNEMVNLTAVKKTMEDTIKVFEGTIKKLSSAFCPLSESITCNSIKEREKLKGEFEDEIKAQQEGIDIQNKLIEETKVKLADLQKRENEYNANAASYQQKLILKKQLEDAKKATPVLPAKPAALTIDAEAIKEKKRLLEAHKQRIAKCAERDANKVKLADLSVKYDILDQLVSLLSPKGKVSLGVMDFYKTYFEELINATATKLRPGFQIKLIVGNGVKIECETHAGSGFIPYESLSSGERAYVIYLFLNLFTNGMTGVHIMLLDDLDKLDSDAFNALIEILTSKEVIDQYDHIFIASVNHPDTIATLKSKKNIDLQELV